jgi:hypothetical protein
MGNGFDFIGVRVQGSGFSKIASGSVIILRIVRHGEIGPAALK